MFKKKSIRNLAVILAVSLLSSCYRHIEVKPTELAKLNHAYSVPTGTTLRTTSSMVNGRSTLHTSHETVFAHSDIPMEKPDGRVVSIQGKPDGIRITSGGRVMVFEKPFIVEPVEDGVVLKSANQAATPYRYSYIDKAEVKYYDGETTVWVMVACVGISLLGMFLYYGSKSDDEQSYKKSDVPYTPFTPMPGWRF